MTWLCEFSNITRQSFYKAHANAFSALAAEKIVVEFIRDIRKLDPYLSLLMDSYTKEIHKAFER